MTTRASSRFSKTVSPGHSGALPPDHRPALAFSWREPPDQPNTRLERHGGEDAAAGRSASRGEEGNDGGLELRRSIEQGGLGADYGQAARWAGPRKAGGHETITRSRSGHCNGGCDGACRGVGLRWASVGDSGRLPCPVAVVDLADARLDARRRP